MTENHLFYMDVYRESLIHALHSRFEKTAVGRLFFLFLILIQ